MDRRQLRPYVQSLPAPASASLEVAREVAHVRSLARRSRLATPMALLFLCALGLAFFWRVVLLHQMLLPADILYAKDPLWQSLVLPASTVPANPLDSDALTEFYPWTALSAQALHAGVLPLWNPYAFAGTPFLAAMQTAVLYPINLVLELLVAPSAVLGLRAVVHLVVTLVGTFLFARRCGRSHPAALLTAVTFGLSLPYVVWLEHPMAGAIAWLPWLLLCVDGVLDDSGRLRWLLGTALVVALEFLAGHGESTAHIALLCAAYTLFRLLHRPSDGRTLSVRRRLQTVASLSGSVLLGTALASAHLLPSLVQIERSEAAFDRALLPSVGVVGDPTTWKTMLTALVPNVFGSPTWHVALLPLSQGYNEVALYCGILPPLLAIVALQRRVGETMFFAGAALVALGMALRLPGFALLDTLPVLRLAANGRLRVEYVFALAMLAGLGLEALRSASWNALTGRLLRGGALVVALIVACALPSLLGAAQNGHGAALPLGAALSIALPLLWVGLAAACLWLVQRRVLSQRALGWLLGGIVTLDLCSIGIGYHTTVSPSVVTAPPAVRAVAADRSLYRVVGLGTALLPSLSSLYGLQDVRGYDPAYSSDYEQFFMGAFSVDGGMRLSLAPFGPSPVAARILNLLNVRYLFTACSVTLNPVYYRVVYRGAGCVYRNLAMLPRAVLTHALRWGDEHTAAALLERGAIDPRRTTILDVAGAARTTWSVAPQRGAESASVIHDGFNDVTVRVHSSAAAVLLLSEVYAPGWSATVDGHRVPLARADAVLRGVPVAGGDHLIQMTYRPPAFIDGVAISALALLASLVLAAWGGRRRYRQRSLAIAAMQR